MCKENKSNYIELILDRIRKSLNIGMIGVDQVFDEETNTYSENGKDFLDGYLQGVKAGRIRTSIALGVKLLEILALIEEDTNFSLQELNDIREYGFRIEDYR